MTGMLIHRNYGTFRLSGPGLQGSLPPAVISEEQWMGVYLKGEKVGYLSRKISPAPNGYALSEDFRIKTIVMGSEKNVETLLNANLSRSLKLISFSAKIKADLDIDITGRVQGKDLAFTIDSSGVKTSRTLHLEKEPTLDGPALTGMLRGLKTGDRISIPVFDPTFMGVEDLDLTIAGKEKLTSLGKLKEAYKIKGNMKGIDFNVWVTEKGEVLKEESPAGFLFIKEAKEDALRTGRPSLDLVSQSAVPCGVKLPGDISYMKIRMSGIDFKGLSLDGGRQRLKGDILEISREIIGPKSHPVSAKERAFDEYLGDTVFIQSKDSSIVELARKIVKDGKDPWLRPGRFMTGYTGTSKRPRQ